MQCYFFELSFFGTDIFQCLLAVLGLAEIAPHTSGRHKCFSHHQHKPVNYHLSLIRTIIPKRARIDDYHLADIDKIIENFNDRSMGCLYYLITREVLIKASANPSVTGILAKSSSAPAEHYVPYHQQSDGVKLDHDTIKQTHTMRAPHFSARTQRSPSFFMLKTDLSDLGSLVDEQREGDEFEVMDSACHGMGGGS